jgi:hypothetical protein
MTQIISGRPFDVAAILRFAPFRRFFHYLESERTPSRETGEIGGEKARKSSGRLRDGFEGDRNVKRPRFNGMGQDIATTSALGESV